MVLEEAARRFGSRAEESARAPALSRRLLSTRFDKQLGFLLDRSRRKAAFCTRRAGKTDNTPTDFFLSGLEHPRTLGIHVAITRLRAKELVWDEFKKTNYVHQIGARFNDTELSIRFGADSLVRLTGADKMHEAEKKRGDKTKRVRIDEAQMFPSSILKALSEDIFGPALEDLGGDIALMGTPGIVCAGYWYDITRPDMAKRSPGWSVHRWSVLDNPHMAHMKARLPEMMRERNWTADNPTYRREWLGEWVNDFGALLYAFHPERNLYSPEDPALPSTGWSHILGLDLGLRDAMALVLWGFHPSLPGLYERLSWKKSGVLIDELVAKIRETEAQPGVNVIARVADTGGLGALIVEEIAKRHQIRFEAAKKREKAAHVELFNDDLRTGRTKLLDRSPLQEEMAVLPKDPDGDPDKPPVEHPGFDNHCCDAGLYAWRRALHYLHEAQPEGPARGSPEFYAREAAEMERKAMEQFSAERQAAWWEQ